MSCIDGNFAHLFEKLTHYVSRVFLGSSSIIIWESYPKNYEIFEDKMQI